MAAPSSASWGSNLLRSLVSKKKRRFQQDGFDLDLTYITDRVVAMGFPSERIEGVYRNPLRDVRAFLERRHGNHYRIYNLCSERDYRSDHFNHRVVRYPFDDHHPPPMGLFLPFSRDVEAWLRVDPRNVAVVHCKAGKGRTGVMICALMVYCGYSESAEEAMAVYGARRTRDAKGVTIPSQQRFVHYFGRLCTPRGQSKAFQRADPVPLDHTEEAMELLSSQAAEDGAIPGDDAAAQAASEKARRAGEVDGEGRRVPRPGAGAAAEEEGEEEEGAESPVFPGPGFALMPPTPVLLLRRVHLSSVPHVAGLRAFGYLPLPWRALPVPQFKLLSRGLVHKSKRFFMEEFKSGSRESVDIPCPGLHVEGEVKMTLYDRTRVAKRKLFHFWFHTAFVDGMALRLSKAEIDGCHRDTHHRVFGEGFSVLLEFGPAMETASNGAASRASIAGEEMETVAVSGPDGGEGAAADAEAAPGCRGDMVAPMPVDGESDTEVTGTEDDGVGEAEAGAADAPAQG